MRYCGWCSRNSIRCAFAQQHPLCVLLHPESCLHSITPECVLARDRLIRRSQSAVELRTLGLPRQTSDLNLKELQQVTVELTTPEVHVYKVGRLSNEERAQKILK